MINSLYNNFVIKPIAILIIFFIGELIFSSILKKTKAGWKIRFVRSKGYGQLSPVQKTWKIALIFLLLIVFIIPIIDFIFWYNITNLLSKLGFYLIFLFIIIFCVDYLWITEVILETKWRNKDWIPVVIIIIMVILWISIYYLQNK